MSLSTNDSPSRVNKIPSLIYGTAWKKERTAELVKLALECGFRGIDTACQPRHYHEAGVGEGIALALQEGLNRDALYIQTKFTPLDGQDPERIPYDARASLSTQVAQSFAVSLQNLRTNYLDALILHSPLSNPDHLLEVWRAMEKIHADEGTRLLGISNCYQLEQLQFLWQHARVKPAIVQNRFYAATQYDRALRQFCRQEQIIYQSFWTLTANPSLLNHPVIAELAEQYHWSAAQLLFRYLTQRGIVPLTGTTSKIHMLEDLAIFDLQLSEAQCASIDAVISSIH